MGKNKRVLILTTPFRPNIGGVETHLDDLISAVNRRGIRSYILTYQPLITKAWGKIVENGERFTVYRIPWFRFNLFLLLEKYPILEFLYLFPALFLFGLFFFVLKNSEIKIIHAQGLIAGTVGVMLGKIFTRKVIISTHSIYNFPQKGLYREFIKIIFNNCTKILTLSNQSKNEIKQLGISEDRISMFTYWVDQKLFKPSPKFKARKVLNLSPDQFICLFVGRLVAVKGVNEFLQAAKITKQAIFLIIGDGPLANEVTKAEEGSNNIIFRGKIENNKLPDYYNASDILIVPSVHEEGFGRVILEALSCGLSVIAAKRGGIKESLSSEVGMLIEIKPSKLKKAVEEIMGNKTLLNLLRSRAVKYAKKNFSEKNVDLILKYYG